MTTATMPADVWERLREAHAAFMEASAELQSDIEDERSGSSLDQIQERFTHSDRRRLTLIVGGGDDAS
jgi:hypothetical protein